MATVRSVKTGRTGHRGSGPERKSAVPSRAGKRSGLEKGQSNLPSQASERGGLSRFSDLTLIAFLVVGAALPYLNTLRNDFVSDDEMQVLHNPFIRSFHFLTKIFTTQATSYIPEMPNFYRPLMNVGYLLCYQVFGVRPFGYHLVNLVLHASVVCVVFLLTKRMFQNRETAFMTAALFAIHPIHSEAVAWVGASPDLELSLFYLLTFWLYLAVARPGGRFSYTTQLAMAGSFALTIFSKEPAVTLPVLATAYEHLYRPDRQETTTTQKVQRYLVLWVMTIAYLLFRVHVLGSLSSGSSVHHLSWYETSLSALMLLGQYYGKLIWPVDLRIFCPFHAPSSLFDLPVLGGLTALAVYIALLLFFWRRARPLSFGLLWMLVPLAPVLNARWMPVAAFEERYLYLPSVGFCWLLGWGILEMWDRASARHAMWRPALATAFGILAVLCLFRIVTRNRDWRDNLTLYTNTLAACPEAYYVRRDLGLVYYDKGDDDSAEREWRESLRTNPQHALSWSSLGLMYLRKQDYSQAIEYFKKALGFDPRNSDAHLFLGVAYMDTNSLALAEPQLRATVSIYPFNSNARNSLGKLYLAEGRGPEAEEQFRRSVEIEPNIMGFSNLGVIHWDRGDVKSAEQEWRAALRLAPNDPSLLNDLGLVSMNQGRYAEAVSYFRQAVGLKPRDPLPYVNLGIAYGKLGQDGSAETEFRTALSLSPQLLEARNRLGMLYLNAARLDAAEEQFRLSIKAQPNAWAYSGLGETYWRRGEREAAERAFQSAASLDPNDSQAHFKLGALYLSRGRKAEALREYQAGLKNDPKNGDALAAVQKLSGPVREK